VENASEKSQNVAYNRVLYGYKWVVSDLPDSSHTLLVCDGVNIYAYDSLQIAVCGLFFIVPYFSTLLKYYNRTNRYPHSTCIICTPP
jgi:hypothetical protein